jgi:hypothetical protein
VHPITGQFVELLPGCDTRYKLFLPRCLVKPFTTLAIVILSMMALLQLIRIILSWTVIVNGFVIPLWVSGIAFLVAGTCAVMLAREARQ